MSAKIEQIQLPTIHLNGTSQKMLFTGYDRAASLLHNFTEAWSEIEFNARDYYVDGPQAWGKAMDCRQEISRRIQEVKDYLNAHREHLYVDLSALGGGGAGEKP